MSYFKSRNLLLVMALGLALVLLAIIVLRYRPESPLQRMEQVLPKGVDVALQDIDYTHVEQGQARWRLVARQVERLAESGSLSVDNPQMNFYDERGEEKGSVQADRGVISDDYQNVGLRGDVVLRNSAGYTLYTDSLDYDQSTQAATSDDSVRLVGDGISVEGTGLELYPRQDRFLLNAKVRASFDSAKMK